MRGREADLVRCGRGDSGYTFWDLKAEAPDLFVHLSESDLVIFKGYVSVLSAYLGRLG